MWSILWTVEGRNRYACTVGINQVTHSISSFYTTCSYDLKASQDTFTRIGLYIINRRCPLPCRSSWWGAVIYYVWSQAALSTSTPLNDFLHRPEWLGTTVAMNLIHSAAGYTCRWRQRNSEGGGQVPPVEKKWVTSITQNTAYLHSISCGWIAFLSIKENANEKKRYFCLLSDGCFLVRLLIFKCSVLE